MTPESVPYFFSRFTGSYISNFPRGNFMHINHEGLEIHEQRWWGFGEIMQLTFIYVEGNGELRDYSLSHSHYHRSNTEYLVPRRVYCACSKVNVR